MDTQNSRAWMRQTLIQQASSEISVRNTRTFCRLRDCVQGPAVIWSFWSEQNTQERESSTVRSNEASSRVMPQTRMLRLHSGPSRIDCRGPIESISRGEPFACLHILCEIGRSEMAGRVNAKTAHRALNRGTCPHLCKLIGIDSRWEFCHETGTLCSATRNQQKRILTESLASKCCPKYSGPHRH